MPVPIQKRRFATLVAILAAVIAVPMVVVATNRFDDVPNSNVHHDNITWLADNGVTLGCNPPANDNYCPDDNVSRAQMASFMRRLAENQVVDAATAVEADNADALDGQAASAYQTRVMAATCGIEVAPGPVAETTCLPAAGGMVNNGVAAEVFAIPLNLAEAGTLQLSSTSLSGDTIAWSFTLNAGCSNDPETLFNRAVSGHLWGSEAGFSTAAHLVANAPAGAHTLRLCGLNQSGAAVELLTSSLAAVWTAGGSVNVLSTDSSPVDMPDLLGG